jgi:hypothetical protein
LLYRRRAQRSPEEAERWSSKAERFERRAQAKRSGARMPRDLRTPKETADTVDEFRRRLREACVVVGRELEEEDLTRFRGWLVEQPFETGLFQVGGGSWEYFLLSASALLHALGATEEGADWGDVIFAEYQVPIAEGEAEAPADEPTGDVSDASGELPP